MRQYWKYTCTMAFALTLVTTAHAAKFDVPGGDLSAALNAYSSQSGVYLMVSTDAIRGVKTKGVKGDLSSDVALIRVLKGTGFISTVDAAGGVSIVRDMRSEIDTPKQSLPMQLAATPAIAGASLETVTVTSSKIGGDVQNIPISITALSQEQLTATQTAGGPDLVKQVPNLTFTKTNFSGYSIQIRGIGTQAISVTTDPAVAVAFNDIPFIRNHFFEQEFYDVAQVQVLRGPQGTLYGRNATAGVVNLSSAKPSDQFEAMASADIGNYQNRRLEAMINVPIVDDRLDLRVAGEWTKRDGYTFNEGTGQPIDGRDLWSGRVTLGIKPTEKLQTYLIWEHFSENDDRLRSSKQLCKTDTGPTEVLGNHVRLGTTPLEFTGPGSLNDANIFGTSDATLSQGCAPTSLYSPDAFGTPFGPSLPYVQGGEAADVVANLNPYDGNVQSRNLRVIGSVLTPSYRAKNDTLEFNADYTLTPTLTLTSQTGYNQDFLYSLEDFNRFNTAPGFFGPNAFEHPAGQGITTLDPQTGTYFFCDPQLGCSDRLVGEDLSDENAWQLSQEFRLASNFSGPFNFSVGGNYLHYETEENYYVFFNTLTALATVSGLSTGHPNHNSPDNSDCLPLGFNYSDPNQGGGLPPIDACPYIDPNPIGAINSNGHNYFLSQNPYVLNSYAGFGEVNYQIFSDLKLTGGLRWTEDRKHFLQIPSWVVGQGWGYPVVGVVNQQWDQWTGRAVANWTPKLDFTDQTLVYGSYSHGYKAGGANPPGPVLAGGPGVGNSGGAVFVNFPDHPLTFRPEFIDAFEMGTKNTALDGSLTFNGSIFYYNYKDYQISEIVDRTAINLNFDAHIKGAEVEATWEAVPGFKINFASGYEDTAVGKGQRAIDLMDRTAGNPNWMVVKPFVTQASNCILPTYVVAAMVQQDADHSTTSSAGFCEIAYSAHLDPLTGLAYVRNPTISWAISTSIPPGYVGFDPLAGASDDLYGGQNVSGGIDYGPAPNNGEGFAKDLSGNKLPNAPPFTVSFGAQYTIPLSTDWAGTLRGDYYWQDYSWARVFNDNPYDRLRGYTNVNLTLIFTNQNGWQVMGYVKNMFDTTDITGTFLNSDDTGLTTNVFLTDPRLFGVRVTKNW
jgi:iron complex outermembrane recepter protein